MIAIGGPPHMVMRGLQFPPAAFEEMSQRFEAEPQFAPLLPMAPDVFDRFWCVVVAAGESRMRLDYALFDLIRYDRLLERLDDGEVFRVFIARLWVLRRAGVGLAEAFEEAAADLSLDAGRRAAAERAMRDGQGLAAALSALGCDDKAMVDAFAVLHAPTDLERGIDRILDFFVDEYERPTR
jgi:type II secretory pathway component PulF